jgi:hypothetical protein
MYETYLPYLNAKPLTATIADNVDEKRPEGGMPWTVPAKGGDVSLYHNCVEACSFILRRKNFTTNKVGLLAVLIEWQMCKVGITDTDSRTAAIAPLLVCWSLLISRCFAVVLCR